MKLARVRKLATGLLVSGMFFALLGGFVVASGVWQTVLSAIALGCLAGYWAVLMKGWRCPKCKRLLPVKQHFYSVKNCPECGEELDLNRW